MALLISFPAYGGTSEMAPIAKIRQRKPLFSVRRGIKHMFMARKGTHHVMMNSRSKYPPRNGIDPTKTTNVPRMLMIMMGCHVVISIATMMSSLSTRTV